MNPTNSVLVVVVLLVLLQLLNHPFPGKVVGKVILGYHHYAKSYKMICLDMNITNILFDIIIHQQQQYVCNS